MAVYSIKEVETLTGIRAHTLRAWEQRYDLVTPRRSKTNVRYYLEEDVRELSTIALLNRNGYRISQIAEMDGQERRRQAAELSSLNVSPDTQLDLLTLSIVELDEEKFSLIVDTNIDQRGFEETMMEVIYPFLDKLGVLYFTGSVSPAQEAFAGALIRQKILAATDRLPAAGDAHLPTFALFLPTGDRQDLSMLFIRFLLKQRGFPVLYLGQQIAASDLADVCRAREIDYLFTLLTNNYVEHPVGELVEDILAACPDAHLVVAGQQVKLHHLDRYERVDTVAGLQELLAYVQGLSTPADRNIAVAK